MNHITYVIYIYTSTGKKSKHSKKIKKNPKNQEEEEKGDMGIIISSLGRVFLLLFLLVWVTEGLTQPKFFNVMDYGAVGGGKTDNSQVIYIYTHIKPHKGAILCAFFLQGDILNYFNVRRMRSNSSARGQTYFLD